MTMRSNRCKEYENVPDNWNKKGDPSILDCCQTVSQPEPDGCDCCYDTWSNELKAKQDELGRKTELANQAKEKLSLSKSKRDGLKKWLDELDLLDDYARDICVQFSLIISLVRKICDSSKNTVQAAKILFCMIRDFYSQLDKIKNYYISLQKCIDELDKTILVPDKGIMKCLKSYNEKLDAILATKDDLVRQVMEVVKTANLVEEDVCANYGLSCVLEKWQCILHCKLQEGEEPCGDSDDTKDEQSGPCSELDLDCVLCPQLSFPVKEGKYYESLKKAYGVAIKEVNQFNDEYLDFSQQKEAIAACIASLKEATAATDPRERCK